MAYNYAKAQATAVRLLKKFGQVVSMSRASAGTYDPATGTTSGTTITTQSLYVASIPATGKAFSDSMLEDVVKGRIRFFIAAAVNSTGGALSFTPAPGDLLSFEGKKWEILGNTPTNPAGVAVIHEFSAKEGGAS